MGQSHSYLLDTLREVCLCPSRFMCTYAFLRVTPTCAQVRLLEKLHHPNIITYHHAWLESCQFFSFGPRVPTLQ